MKLPIIFFSLFLLRCAASRSKKNPPRVCTARTAIAHDSVILPFSEPTPIRVPLILYYPCRIRHAETLFPLLILLQGALLRPDDYSVLSTILARRGFIVAIPDYTQRRFLTLSPFNPQLGVIKEHIRETRRAGFDCPRNSQTTSVQLMVSVLRFFSHAPPKSRFASVRRKADVKNVMLFGHSQGGGVANLFFSPACVPFSNPVDGPIGEILSDPMIAGQLVLRLICEQYKPFTSRDVRVAGVVSFEGLDENNAVAVPEGTFHVAVHSPFVSESFDEVLRNVSVQGNLVRVVLGGSNHFAPNNFVRTSDSQTPVCAIPRSPPEDMFNTTRERQRLGIKSIAKIVTASHLAFVRGRGIKRLTALRDRENLSIEQVSVV